MLNNYPFAQVFQNIGQRLREDPTIDLQIVIKCSSNNDRRCYNLPTVEEVAVFMPGIDGEEFQERDIILKLRDGGVRHISSFHPSYDPLHYVLMFPYGTDYGGLGTWNTTYRFFRCSCRR